MQSTKTTLNSIIRAGKCFGFTPISFNGGFPKTSKVAVVYGVGVAVVYGVLFVCDLALRKRAKNDLVESVNMMQIVSCLVQFLGNFGQTWKNLGGLKSLVQILLQLEVDGKRAGMAQKEFRTRNVFVLALILSLTLTALTTSVEFYHVYSLNPFNLRFYLIYIGLFFSTINVVQIGLFAYVIFGFYHKLCEHLVSLLGKNGKIGLGKEDLSGARKILLRANNAVEVFNGFYSYHLVFLFGNNFIFCTVQMYHIFCSEVEEEYYLFFWLSALSKIVIYTLQILAIIFGFQQILNKISEIVKTLLLIYSQEYPGASSAAFDIAMQQRTFPVTFKAGNFFEINNSTLLTMVGTIATYLIILVQFKGSNGVTPKIKEKFNYQFTGYSGPKAFGSDDTPLHVVPSFK